MNWNQDLQHPSTTQIAYRGQNHPTIKHKHPLTPHKLRTEAKIALQSSIPIHIHPRPYRTTQTTFTEAKIALQSSITSHQCPRPPRITQTAHTEAKIAL